MSSIDLNLKQRNVLHIITMYPQAANDEAMLLEKYWETFDDWHHDKSLYWNLSRVTRPETITRRRRELFNLGLIEYSDKAEKDRIEAMINEQDFHVGEAVSWL